MTTKRRTIVGAGCAGLLIAINAPVVAQQSAGVPRIGLLWIKSRENTRHFDTLVESLRARGFVVGKHVHFDARFLVDRYDDLAASAENLSRESYAVIVCFGTTATLAMAKATSTLPIVTVSGLDPVRAGVAVSLARPGRNLTGYVSENEPMGPKRIEMLKEAVPNLRRMGVLYAPQSPGQVATLDRIIAAGNKLKVHVTPIEISSPAEIKSVAARIKKAGVDGVLVGAATLFYVHLHDLVREVESSRMPAIFQADEYVVAGGLMSYGPNLSGRFQKAATFVERILKEAKPADMPIEQETRYDLVVNLKTAKLLGLTIPQSILVRADRVIE